MGHGAVGTILFTVLFSSHLTQQVKKSKKIPEWLALRKQLQTNCLSSSYMHLGFVLAHFLDMLLTELLFISVRQVYPIVWSDKLRASVRYKMPIPSLHSLLAVLF
jgi:hypothetical protein